MRIDRKTPNYAKSIVLPGRYSMSKKQAVSASCRLPFLLSAAVATAIPCAAQAERAMIEEIIVTAQKREESLQSAPIAITAYTAEGLQDRGITDFEGVARVSPNVSFTPYPSSANTLIMYIRGQGVTDVGQITLDNAVGMYQDGFYISRPQLSAFDLADIERVEVLRGPQGTLYGRNATGGAVNLISKKPSGEFGFKQEFGFGNSGRVRSLSVLDLPQWGDFAAKLSFLKRQRDGYVRNPGSGNDFGEESQAAGRLALRWENEGPFSADYFFETADLDSTPLYYTNPALVGVIPGYADRGKPEDRSYRAFDLPKSTGNMFAHGLTLSWEVNDALTLESLTGYRDIDTNSYQNYADVFFVGFRSVDNIDSDQFSQELRAVGNLFDGRINYIAALYYFEEDAKHFQNVTITDIFPPPLLSTKDRYVDAHATSKAAYAQLGWTPPVLDDRLELTFGARYTEDERSATRQLQNYYFDYLVAEEPASGLINTNDLDSNRFNPAFTTAFSWTDNVSTYLRIATGYKAGGSSESVDVGQFGLTFKPEDVIVYELGVKSYFLDRRVRLNAAVFDSRYEDMQMVFNTNPSDTSIVLGLNAGKASVSGLELEALWQPAENLSISVDYAYLDTSFDEVIAPANTIFDPAINSASPYEVGQDIKNLFVMPYSPENSVNVSANWTFLTLDRSSFTAILNYRWEDDIYMMASAGSDVPDHEQASRPSFGLWDARLSWQNELSNQHSLRVDIWGKNISDRKWASSVMGLGSPVAVSDPVSGTITPAGFASSITAWAERPLYGVDLIYEF